MTTSLRPLSAEMITIPGRDWRQLAACRHADPELFFLLSASAPCLDQITQGESDLRRLPCPPAMPGLRAGHQAEPRRVGRHERAGARAWSRPSSSRRHRPPPERHNLRGGCPADWHGRATRHRQLLSTLAREAARLAATEQPFRAAFAVAEMTMRPIGRNGPPQGAVEVAGAFSIASVSRGTSSLIPVAAAPASSGPGAAATIPAK